MSFLNRTLISEALNIIKVLHLMILLLQAFHTFLILYHIHERHNVQHWNRVITFSVIFCHFCLSIICVIHSIPDQKIMHKCHKKETLYFYSNLALVVNLNNLVKVWQNYLWPKIKNNFFFNCPEFPGRQCFPFTNILFLVTSNLSFITV